MSVQFSPEATAQIERVVARYPEKQAALLPVLHLAQREFGHLSIEIQSLVAGTLGIPKVLVREVTTFYEMFHEHPEGQFHLEVCTNIACHLAGGDRIVDHVKKRLGIEVGHHDESGLFSLAEAECLASCGSAPMMRVGMDYYEFLTIEAVDALIARFRDLAPRLNGRAYEQGPDGPHVGPVQGHAPPRPDGKTSAVPPSAGAPTSTDGADKKGTQ